MLLRNKEDQFVAGWKSKGREITYNEIGKIGWDQVSKGFKRPKSKHLVFKSVKLGERQSLGSSFREFDNLVVECDQHR